MFFTPAYAQTAGGGGGANLFELLMPFFLILIIMYFLVIRPQQKRMKDHQEMLGGLRRGDEIVTGGGLIGKISKVKEGDEEIEVEIAQGVFSPTPEDVDRARRMREAFDAAIARGEGAAQFEGRMIDIASMRIVDRIVDRADLIGM